MSPLFLPLRRVWPFFVAWCWCRVVRRRLQPPLRRVGGEGKEKEGEGGGRSPRERGAKAHEGA
jgi:hypothetical protein